MLEEDAGGEDSAVVVKRDVAYTKSAHGFHMPKIVIPDDDQRIAPCLLYLFVTHLSI